ncbi:unnamed protein product [Leptidea sinapis]|uniref:Uncharacterized protein n=1 Tax=Leptidea sinapis TaxID=189913 RepID=A0A5E4PNN8_9NEOP|nr:unnamed protein product [Leptidea sinapis]
MSKIYLFLAILSLCESVYIYSSFWAPLFNPRILNYRVDMNFDPESGKNSRVNYENNYGYRGEKLIADIGNGKAPSDSGDRKVNGDVKFYYTYPGAANK